MYHKVTRLVYHWCFVVLHLLRSGFPANLSHIVSKYSCEIVVSIQLWRWFGKGGPGWEEGWLIASSALAEQQRSYLYLYQWDYRCWHVRNGSAPVCTRLHRPSSCHWSSQRADGFSASDWKMNYRDWWIAAALWLPFLIQYTQPTQENTSKFPPPS